MLINSAWKMPSIERRISIEFRDPAHQLSANILDSYLWRYLYLPSVSRLIHEHLRMFFKTVGSKLASESILTNSALICLVDLCFK